MIKGIGTDIIKISRIEKSLSRQGFRFAKKVLSANELDVFLSFNTPKKSRIEDSKPSFNQRQVAFLAKRFAVKEAVGKAFGTGIRDGLVLADIEVINDNAGKPSLVFHAQALAMVNASNLIAHLSISDEKKYAVAFVVFESRL